MGNVAYLSIEGKQQGLISRSCNSLDSMGNRYQIDHMDEISVLAMNHQMLRGISAGSQQHSPLQITKNIDKSSPLLAVAWSKGERLTCVLRLYRITPNGSNECYYEIELQEAEIVSVCLSMPHVSMEEAEPQERVSIRYRDICWRHIPAGTMGYDTWDDLSWMETK
ncbi:Hcp family type VI secretion system effector [Photobacterium indicum]|uniref:Hcp family type VI secretion system effector n=1 Tax=Photobacterium indicum TaxID=81447 RepID=UPI003D1439D5